MRYLIILLLMGGCVDHDTEQAKEIIRQSQERYRSDSIFIERQTNIKIEEYKANN